MEDELEETTMEEKETARRNRRKLKEVHEAMLDNKQQMKDVRSTTFPNLLKRYEDIASGMQNANTRELISDAGCLTLLTGALKGQAQTLCDISARFNWQDLATSVNNRFRNDGANAGLDWEKLGSEARIVFNCAPTFTTMVGPIHKEERIRKIAVRRQRENTSGVVNATSETIENDEQDGNNEATNARVAHLMQYLEEAVNFDLLRTLVDPFNPVQSVENFFDYSYLHKEKRVVHQVDEETGEIKGCVKSADELDKVKKSQMVLSISMKDLVVMTKCLYPDEAAERLSQGAAASSSSSSSQRRSNAGTGSSSSHSNSKPHPLHREDPLYDAADAQEQVRILAERARQQKEQKQAKGGNNTQQNAQSTQQQQQGATQSSSSRRASNSRAAPASQPANPATAATSSQGRRGGARDPEAGVALNGSSSSSSSQGHTSFSSSSNARDTTGTPKASRTSAATPGTAASTGTAATAATATPSVPSVLQRNAANRAALGAERRTASPALTPTPPRVPRAASPSAHHASASQSAARSTRTSSPDIQSPAASVKYESVARALGQELINGTVKRGLLGGANSENISSPAAPSTPAGRSSAAMAQLGMQTALLPGVKSLSNHHSNVNHHSPRAESIYASTHHGKENNKRSPPEADLHLHADDAFLSASDKDSQSSGSEFISSARKQMRTQ